MISNDLNEVLASCNGGNYTSSDSCFGCAVCKPSEAGDVSLRMHAAITRRQRILSNEIDTLTAEYEAAAAIGDGEWFETEDGAYMTGQLNLLTELLENGIAAGLGDEDEAFFDRRREERLSAKLMGKHKGQL